MNQTICGMLGYTSQELLAGDWPALTHPDDLGLSQEAAGQLLRDSLPFVELERRYIHRKGHPIWARVRMSQVRDDHGEPLYLITHSEDITERKRGEEAATAREQPYQALFNSCNDAVFVVGLGEDGLLTNFLQVNDAACQRLRYTRDELLERSFPDVDPAQTPGSFSPIPDRLLAGGQFLLETEHVAKDGRRIPTEMNLRLILLDGRRMLMFIARHTTERKRFEEVQRATEHRYRRYVERNAGFLPSTLDGVSNTHQLRNTF